PAALLAALGLCAGASTADVTVTQRHSSAINNFVLTSGTIIEDSLVSDSESDLFGPFSLRNTAFLIIDDAEPGAEGHVSGAGGHTMNDAVTQNLPTSLRVDSFRTSGTIARVLDGVAQVEFMQDSITRVRFNVTGADVRYFITGELDPHADSAVALTFANTSTPGVLENFTGPAAVNETGTLTAGETYELKTTLDNHGVATPSNPSITRVNAYSVRLTVLPMDCRADLDASGIIDFTDLNYLLNTYGTQDVLADINDNQSVDFTDLNALLADFGTACP
ncbi:MAG: hypothetical protein ACTS27_05330, partial [Phycisphaerales bacterium]